MLTSSISAFIPAKLLNQTTHWLTHDIPVDAKYFHQAEVYADKNFWLHHAVDVKVPEIEAALKAGVKPIAFKKLLEELSAIVGKEALLSPVIYERELKRLRLRASMLAEQSASNHVLKGHLPAYQAAIDNALANLHDALQADPAFTQACMQTDIRYDIQAWLANHLSLVNFMQHVSYYRHHLADNIYKPVVNNLLTILQKKRELWIKNYGEY